MKKIYRYGTIKEINTSNFKNFKVGDKKLIKINIFENSLTIDGHTDNEVCARTSTIFQTIAKVFKEKTEDVKIENGFSSVIFKNLTQTDRKYLDLMIDSFRDLSILYPNMVEYTDNRGVQNG